MKSFSISHKKEFMSAVLLHDDFDDFTLSEATVKTAVSFVIDGKINADFFSSEDPVPAEPFVRYGEVRNFFFEIIKGKRTPVYFKFVFHEYLHTTASYLKVMSQYFGYYSKVYAIKK